jgi:hypothetical protein
MQCVIIVFFLTRYSPTHRTKLNLWSQVIASIAEHKDVLSARETLLVDVTQGLVKNGWAVVNGGIDGAEDVT